MVPSRVKPVHVATCVLIIAFGLGANSDSDRKNCDVRMWYLDLVMDGPLRGDLSEEKRALKDKIEKMVNKYKKVGRADGMVDCSILAVYEDLLEADENSQEPQNTKETFTDDSPAQDDNKNLYTAQAMDNDPTQVNQNDNKNLADTVQVMDNDLTRGIQTSSGFKTQENETKNSLSSDGATDDSSSSKQTSNTNVKDTVSENTITDDIFDETDLDETDFGDEEEYGEGNEGSKLEHETQGEEHAQGIVAESNGFSNNNGDMNENSNEATVVGNLNVVKSVEETATGSDDDRSEKDEKLANGEDRSTERKEMHVDDGNVLDHRNGYVTSSEDDNGHKPKDIPGEQADITRKEKATEERSKEYADDINSDAEDTDDEVSNNEAGINTAAKSSDKQDSDSVEEASSTERKEAGVNKKRLIEEYVFDSRRGYIKILKEVDIDTDEEAKDTLEQPDSDAQVPEVQETKSEVEKVETQGSSSINTNERDTTEHAEVLSDEKSEEKREEAVDTSDTLSTLQTMKERCLRPDSCDIYCYYGLTMRQCLDHYPSETFHEQEAKEQSSEPETGPKRHDEDSGTTDEEQHSTANDNVISHAEEHGQTTFDSDTFMEEFKSEDILKSDTQDAEAKKEVKQNNEQRLSTEDSTGQNFNDFTADLHRFELRFQQRAAEYATKIQHLEIMIMKLENQLLGEKLNKQNSSSSFFKLESHILRLENELLKLNQSYAHLQSENDVLKSRQRKYLELGHDKSDKPDNSTKHYELITKQQSKISELASLLMNHSELFDKLQSKSQVLEVQNQALYQIVMNQTALISNIMKKMHELSEENLRQRHETQELKTKLQMKTNSDRLLEKLDNLVSGNGMTRNVVDDGKEEEKATKPLTIFHFLPKSPDAVVFKKPWECDVKIRPQFCLLFSLILSPCPPYSTIYWTKCPYFVKDITKHSDEQTDSNNKIKIDSVNTNNAVLFDSERNFQDSGLEQPTANGINVHIDFPPKEEPSSGTEAQDQPPVGNTQHTTEEVSSAVKDETSERSGEQLKDPKGIPDTETATSGANPGDNFNSANNVHANNAATDDKSDPSAATKESVPASSPSEQAPAVALEQAPAATSQQAPAAGPEQTPAASPEQAPAATPEQAPAASPEQTPAATSQQAPATAPEDRKLLYTATEKTPKPKDCYSYYLEGSKNNGMYKIYAVGLEKTLPVYCDMRGGGWTVLLKRQTGTVDFYREWKDYRKGFGGLYSDHWIGNENLHYITNQDHYRLRVELTDSDNEEVYAEYDTFWTDDESGSYRLHIGGYSGTAGNGFDKHNNMKFSTKDVDNDLVTKELKDHDSSCSKRFHGGWWYYKCYMSNLTGQYYKKGIVPDKKFDGISWKPWKKPNISLKEAVMKIRPLSAED